MKAHYVGEITEAGRAVLKRSLACVFSEPILVEQAFNRRLCYNTNKATQNLFVKKGF